ncbi:hypothetical protein JCM17960_18900 [Magnetospira thiophila]
MYIPFLFGLLLCGLAVMLAGMETISRAYSEMHSILIPASELWRFYDAPSLIAFRESLPLGVWADYLGPLLQAPAWLLLGGPGLILVWVFRNRHPAGLEELEHSLFLFDRLAEEAEKGDHEIADDFDGAQTSDEPMTLTPADRVSREDSPEKP